MKIDFPILASLALVVQWIGRKIADLEIGVRFPSGAQKNIPLCGMFVFLNHPDSFSCLYRCSFNLLKNV